MDVTIGSGGVVQEQQTTAQHWPQPYPEEADGQACDVSPPAARRWKVVMDAVAFCSHRAASSRRAGEPIA
ncbi:hypothetical protein GCM10010231_01890 [Streptomyces sindenensis]|nr:hypothetical protein GCM10010231_01890 [Streptomyces sindenensis]